MSTATSQRGACTLLTSSTTLTSIIHPAATSYDCRILSVRRSFSDSLPVHLLCFFFNWTIDLLPTPSECPSPTFTFLPAMLDVATHVVEEDSNTELVTSIPVDAIKPIDLQATVLVDTILLLCVCILIKVCGFLCKTSSFFIDSTDRLYLVSLANCSLLRLVSCSHRSRTRR